MLNTFRSQRSTAGDDDDIITPYLKVKDTPSRTAWDEEEGTTPGKFSSWDVPTPAMERRERVRFRSLKCDTFRGHFMKCEVDFY